MPLTIMTARPISSSGVSTAPTISTTADWRMHKNRISAKNRIENTTEDTPLMFGTMAISKVVAAVRGMATMGPMHRISALMSTAAGILPRRAVTASLLPTRRSENTANIARPISAIKYAEKPLSQSGPASTPRYGGKITLPAPKNIANSANPTTITSRTVCFLLSCIVVSSFIICFSLCCFTVQRYALKNLNTGYHFFHESGNYCFSSIY